TLRNLCPDIAFFSAAGVHPQYGATCFNLDELPVKHWALEMAQRHVIVADHSKFGQVRPACMGPLEAFDTITTDRMPDDAFIAWAQAANVSVMW
ncbi:DNA-binding transcriptional repressor DeoR, partial [Cronobacter sakazakii]